MQREEWIINEIRNKKVLDIGSIGQSDEYKLWTILQEHSKSVHGVDLPDSIETLESKFNVSEDAYSHASDNITLGNMETLDLNQKFDVVTAGDVIEHVSNQGLFLDNIYKHLNDDGCLLITTPNAKWPTVFLKPNPTHVLWHDQYTLRILLERHNFEVKETKFYVGNKPHYNAIKFALAYHQSIYVKATKKLL